MARFPTVVPTDTLKSEALAEVASWGAPGEAQSFLESLNATTPIGRPELLEAQPDPLAGLPDPFAGLPSPFGATPPTTVNLGVNPQAGSGGDTSALRSAIVSYASQRLGSEGAQVIDAVLETEGGLGGAVGDNGQSHGPFQFYSGGGQLNNLAKALGTDDAYAAAWVRENPAQAAQWAIDNYLGAAIKEGQAKGLTGADLATYAQQYGQVSVSPERAGQNYARLYGGGAGRSAPFSDSGTSPAYNGTPGIPYGEPQTPDEQYLAAQAALNTGRPSPRPYDPDDDPNVRSERPRRSIYELNQPERNAMTPFVAPDANGNVPRYQAAGASADAWRASIDSNRLRGRSDIAATLYGGLGDVEANAGGGMLQEAARGNIASRQSAATEREWLMGRTQNPEAAAAYLDQTRKPGSGSAAAQLGKAMISQGESIGREYSPDRGAEDRGLFQGTGTLEDVKQPAFWRDQVVRQLPFTAAGMAVSLPAGVAGAAVAGPAGGLAGALGAPVAFEAWVESGQAFTEAKRRGMTDEQAVEAGNKAFVGNIAALALDPVQLASMGFGRKYMPPALRRIIDGQIAKTVPKKVLYEAGRLVLNSGIEGSQEVAQNMIQDWSLGDPVALDTPENRQSAMAAVGMSMVTGGASSGRAVLTRTSEAEKRTEAAYQADVATKKGNATLAEFHRARSEGQIDDETYRVATYVAELRPEMGANTVWQVTGELKLATRESLRSYTYTEEQIDEMLASDTPPIETGMTDTTPATETSPAITTIKIFAGADATTVLEEKYHQVFDWMPESERAEVMGLHAQDGATIRPTEWYAKGATKWAMSQKPWSSPIERIWDRTKTAVGRLAGRVSEIEGSNVDPQLVALLERQAKNARSNRADTTRSAGRLEASTAYQIKPRDPNRPLAPAYYSQLERTLEQKMPNRASAEQISGILRGSQVKPEELDWSGFQTFLEKRGQEITALREKQSTGVKLTDQERTLLQITKDEALAAAKAGRFIPEETIRTAKGSEVVDNAVRDASRDWTRLANASGKAYDISREMFETIKTALEQTGQGGRGVGELAQRYTAATTWVLEGNPLGDFMESRDEIAARDYLPEGHHLRKAYTEAAAEVKTAKAAREASDAAERRAMMARQTLRPKYDQYMPDGGQNYQETLLHTRQPFIRGEGSRWRDEHWEDTPNVIGHLRTDERTTRDGTPTLYGDEAQSDLHQGGRKHGYNTAIHAHGKKFAAFDNSPEYEDGSGTWIEIYHAGRSPFTGHPPLGTGHTIEEAIKDAKINNRDVQISPEDIDPVENAGMPAVGKKTEGPALVPYEKTWTEQLLKRALRQAAEKNLFRIAIAKADVHVRRWGTERIAWVRNPDGSFEITIDKQRGGDAAGVNLEQAAVARGLIANGQTFHITKVDDLSDAFSDADMEHAGAREEAEGRSTIDRLWKRMQAEPEGVMQPRREGMEGAYDKVMPLTIQKYVKRWGLQVGEDEIDTGTVADEDRSKWEKLRNRREHLALRADGPARELREERRVIKSILERGDSAAEDVESWTEKLAQIGKEMAALVPDKLLTAQIELLDLDIAAIPTQKVPVWTIDLTESARDAILYDGQPAYQIVQVAKGKKPSAADEKVQRVLDGLATTGFVNSDVAAAVLGDRPEYLDAVARFVLSQREKYNEGQLTTRDLAKAYFMTVASQGATAINLETLAAKTGLDVPPRFTVTGAKGQAQVRPEEAAAWWLGTPDGQEALASIERGEFDYDAWHKGVDLRRAGFGDDRMTRNNVLSDRGPMKRYKSKAKAGKAVGYNFTNLSELADALNAAKGDLTAIDEELGRLKGISSGKLGFIKHLLGFGDTPTVDAVVTNFWLTGRGDIGQLRSREAAFAREVKDVLDDKRVGALLRDRILEEYNGLREQGYGADLDPQVFAHVMHHWLWDRAKNTETRHAGMYEAQRSYQIRPGERRFFHGTGSGFDAVEKARLDEEGLYGAGYYMTDNPEVAAAYARVRGYAPDPKTGISLGYATERRDEARQKLAEATTDHAKATWTRILADAERTYQETLDATTTGPNIRALAVSDKIRLLDAEKPIGKRGLTRLMNTMGQGDLPMAAPDSARRLTAASTGDDVYRALFDIISDEGGRHVVMNIGQRVTNALRIAGYDGIAYGGGQRMPMQDDSGKDITHQVIMIFPDSIRKVRNELANQPERAYQIKNLPDADGTGSPEYRELLRTIKGPTNELDRIEGNTPESAGTVVVTDSGAMELGPIDERTEANLGNLKFLGVDDATRATLIETARLNPEMFEAFRRGVISHDQLVADVSRDGGMTIQEFLATKAGRAFNEHELIALRAANVAAKARLVRLADEAGLEPRAADQVKLLHAMIEARALQAVARGASATSGRTLNAHKVAIEQEWALAVTARSDRARWQRELDNQQTSIDKIAADLEGRAAALGIELPSMARVRKHRGGGYTLSYKVDAQGRAIDPRTGKPMGEGESFALSRTKRLEKAKAAEAAAEETLATVPAEYDQIQQQLQKVETELEQATVELEYLNAAPAGLTINGIFRPASMLGIADERVEEFALRYWDPQDPYNNTSSPYESVDWADSLDSVLLDELRRFSPARNAEMGKGYKRKKARDEKQYLSAERAPIAARQKELEKLLNRALTTLEKNEVAKIQAEMDAAESRKAALEAQRAAKREELAQAKTARAQERQAAREERRTERNSELMAKALLDAMDEYEEGLQKRALRWEKWNEREDARAAKREAGTKQREADKAQAGHDTQERRDLHSAIATLERDVDRLRLDAASGGEARIPELTDARNLLAAKRQRLIDLTPELSDRQKDYKAQQAYLRENRNRLQEGVKEEKKAWAALAKAEAVQERVDERKLATAKRLLERMGGADVTLAIVEQFQAVIRTGDPIAIAKFLQAMQKTTWWERATILRYGSMLSSIGTHATNITSNAAMAALEVPIRGLAGGIDAARSAVTGGPRTVYAAEMGPLVAGWVQGFQTGAALGMDILRTGIDPLDVGKVEMGQGQMTTSFGMEQTRLGKAIGAKASGAVNVALEAPSRLLMAADKVFRTAAEVGEVHALALNLAITEGVAKGERAARAQEIVNNILEYPDLLAEAQTRAARRVFQEDRTEVEFLKGRYKSPAGAAVFSLMVPFVRTPYNIAAQGVAMSPAGFLGAVNAARAGDTGLAAERAARALMGTAFLGLGVALGAAGMLTGGYPDDDDERTTLPAGWQPYSLRFWDSMINDYRYYSYAQIGAPGFVLALAAALGDVAKKEQAGKATNATTYTARAAVTVAGWIADQPFLQGIAKGAQALGDPERFASGVAEGVATQFVPFGAMQRQLTRIMGMPTRDPNGVLEAMMAISPATANAVPVKVDRLGDPVYPGQRGAEAVLPIIKSSPERDDAIRKAARGAGVNIPDAPRNIRNIKLTDAERRAYTIAAGRHMREMAPDWLDGKFQSYTPDGQRIVMERFIARARSMAANEFVTGISKEDFARRRQAGITTE